MQNSDPTPQGVENRNILLWFKCVLTAGADSGGAHPARTPLKLEKIGFFWRKIVIFHMKYPVNHANNNLCT
jgi:hypothetical protein